MSKDSVPPPPNHWRSASQAARTKYTSGNMAINRKLEAFRDEMISELFSTGMISEEDAAFAVNKTLIGLRRNPKGKQPAQYASPVVFEMLDLTEKDKAPPPPSEGWKSANKLRWEDFIGGNVKFSKQIEEIRDTVTANLIEAGLSSEDAAMIVDKTLVGERKPESGISTLHASPIAQDMMNLKMREGQPRVGRPPKDTPVSDDKSRSR